MNALVEIYKKLKFETGRTLYVDLTPKQEEENKNNEKKIININIILIRN